MDFFKTIADLQAQIAKFLELHANPYDTSKHNDLADKLKKVDAALKQTPATTNTAVMSAIKEKSKTNTNIGATIDGANLANEDKICYRFRIEDIGSPQATKDGYKVERTIFFDPDCAESLIPHTNIHGQMDKNGKILKIVDGEYDVFMGKSAWKSLEVKEKLEKLGGGEETFWVYWENEKKAPAIILNKPLEIDFNGCIYPDEDSDYVDEKGNWTPNGKPQLNKVVKILNDGFKNKEFDSLEIKINYNCGSPKGMTGSDCEKRAKNAVSNTIKRLVELGLKIPEDTFKKQTINAFQTEDKSEKTGIDLQIIPLRKK